MPWNLDKNGVTPDRDLTNTEQDHLNEFMNRIRNEGIHPKDACDSWDSHYESLTGDQYSIRLSQEGRVVFTVDNGAQMVVVQSVGSHY
jgi:Txe/YoeB family toxin of Txe-Axe toxin-antitoxin module